MHMRRFAVALAIGIALNVVFLAFAYWWVRHIPKVNPLSREASKLLYAGRSAMSLNADLATLEHLNHHDTEEAEALLSTKQKSKYGCLDDEVEDSGVRQSTTRSKTPNPFVE